MKNNSTFLVFLTQLMLFLQLLFPCVTKDHLFSLVPSEMRDSGLTVLHTKQATKLKRKFKGHQMMDSSHWLKF